MIFQLLACKSLLIPHITTPHILAKCHDIPINADVTRRWTCSSEHTGEIQIVLRTDGIPMDADIQMWNSPDSTPCRMRIYTENGATQHSLTTIQTPNNPYRIAIRNIGRLKDPIHASIFAYKKPYIEPDADKCNVIVQGGTFKAYDFNKCIDNIQVLLQTDGLPLNARIEMWDQLYTTLNSYANDVLGALSAVICINAISKNWKSRTTLGLSYIILLSFSVVSQNPGVFESVFLLISCGLIVSAVLFVLYKELIRFSPELIPIIFSTTSIINTMTEGYQNIYTGQFLGGFVSSILIAGLAFVWYKVLRQK